MSLTSRAHKVDNASPPEKDARHRGAPAPGAAHPGAILQRAKADGASLAPSDVMTLQSSLGNRATRQLLAATAPGRPIQRKENNTGLPDGLKDGIESLSGMSMDDVSVHYNSDKPAQARARAYTQGAEIHVGPGQEGSLPHEAWHVVQQKQGRVTPTLQYKGIDINTDSTLEMEADLMGAKAASLSSIASRLPSAGESKRSGQALGQTMQRKPVRQFDCFNSQEVQADEDPDHTSIKSHGYSKKYDQLFVPDEDKEETLKTAADVIDIEDVQVAISARKKYKDFQKGKVGKGASIELETRKIQKYRIRDTKFPFYTATSKAVWKLIEENGSGLDPSKGGAKSINDVNSASEYMSMGHIYFGVDPETCEFYANKFGLGDGKYVILKFTMPEGAIVTVDPEWSGGFRTTQYIDLENVAVHQ
ncbi:MAG TPA: DUF4157 domain-containing protein [Polyangiaceae bacterium]|nr:DUF4157 domain-containing protein [Polyangiaceae bacterium]